MLAIIGCIGTTHLFPAGPTVPVIIDFSQTNSNAPAAGFGKAESRRGRQRLPFGDRYRIKNEGDIASPAVAGRIHRRQHAIEHRDQARKVVGDQVGADEAGLLASPDKLVEGLVQRVRDVWLSDPARCAAVSRLRFAGAERYRRFDQLGQAPQRVVAAAGVFDRRREILGDALIQGGPNQVGLGRKPTVEGAFADSCAAGDRLNGCIRPSSPYTSRAARRMRSTLRAASARNGRSATVVIVPA